MFKSHGEWKSFHFKHQFVISVFAISEFTVLLDNMTFFISFYSFLSKDELINVKEGQDCRKMGNWQAVIL